MSYNGYTNYATWRVMLELIDGHQEHFQSDLVDMLVSAEIREDDWHGLGTNSMCDMKSIVESYIDNCITEGGENDNIAVAYARAFLNEINYYEIADHVTDHLVDCDSTWDLVKEQFEANGMDY